ncbi:hypothetical protein H6501_04940 [Candidatus Woesearchaeota archaeon]|nr:hypothetical protein [Candidatus Woesearchaeota archaeon]USN44020.1 MAG: hypothetical protein H6500_06545 [Candidatus Woesearchaeota archaeon]
MDKVVFLPLLLVVLSCTTQAYELKAYSRTAPEYLLLTNASEQPDFLTLTIDEQKSVMYKKITRQSKATQILFTNNYVREEEDENTNVYTSFYPQLSALGLSSSSEKISISDGTTTNTLSLTQEQSQVCESPKIKTTTDLFSEKILFTISSSDKTSLEYWVENEDAEEVKKKIVTTVQGEKSFTPKENGYYIIFLEQEEPCKVQVQKKVLFYNSELDKEEETEKDEEEHSFDSNLEILNKETLQETGTIQIAIYKGEDTTKRSVYLYHNKKLIFTTQLQKFEEQENKISFEAEEGENILLLEGLDKHDEYSFELGKEELLQSNEQTEKTKFNVTIANKSLEGTTLLLSLQATEEINSTCYVYKVRTLVSTQEEQNGTNTPNFQLELLTEKLENEENNLTLTCRIYKSGRTSPIYLKENFTYVQTEEKSSSQKKEELETTQTTEYETPSTKKLTLIPITLALVLLSIILLWRR